MFLQKIHNKCMGSTAKLIVAVVWSAKRSLSDAYGFHVRNCVVKNMVSGAQHAVIDSKGCSNDMNIFAHPHYDTYHDVARVHWHAFKLPDHTQLTVKCTIEICTELADENGMNSCSAIPTPPFCPELITSPSNSILSDARPDGNSFKKRSVSSEGHFQFVEASVDGAKESERSRPPAIVQSVHADICFVSVAATVTENNSTSKKSDYCTSEEYQKQRQKHLETLELAEYESTTRICTSRLWMNLGTGFFAGLLTLAALLNFWAVVLSSHQRRRWKLESEEKETNGARAFHFVGKKPLQVSSLQ